MSKFFVSVRSVLTGTLLAATVPALASTEAIFSFEQDPGPTEMVWGWQSSVTRTQLNASEGRYSLRQDVPPNTFGYALYQNTNLINLSNRGTLVADIFNPGDEEVNAVLTAEDPSGKAVRIEFKIEPGQWVHPVMVLSDRRQAQALGLRELPRILDEGRMMPIMSWNDSGCDLTRIRRIHVGVKATPRSQQVYIDNIRVTPHVNLDNLVTSWIDSYGQNARKDWAGKIRSDSDLRQAKTDEDLALAKKPAIRSWDSYGGNQNAPKLQATGFFRTEKIDGRWTLVTPIGSQFWSLGVNGVARQDPGSTIDNKRKMFQWLPPQDHPLSKHYKTVLVNNQPETAFSFARANIERKYGVGRLDLWVDRTLERMKGWGLNTMGAFSDELAVSTGKVPWTVQRTGGASMIHIPLLPTFAMPDPYDPNYKSSLMQRFYARPTDPMLIGYFVHNELPFSARYGRNFDVALGLGVLEQNSATTYAKAELMKQLQAKYSTIGNLNTAWSTYFTSWNQLGLGYKLSDRQNGKLVSDAMYSDLRQYMIAYAHRYYQLTREAVKAVDPNHLYLGSRTNEPDVDVIRVMAQYADVVSVNLYEKSISASGWSLLQNIDKPILISEFSFNSYERGVPGLFVEVKNDVERGQAYKSYIEQCRQAKNIVGAHVFQFADQESHGDSWGNENANVGLVDVTDTPYHYMVASVREASEKIYGQGSLRVTMPSIGGGTARDK